MILDPVAVNVFDPLGDEITQPTLTMVGDKLVHSHAVGECPHQTPIFESVVDPRLVTAAVICNRPHVHPPLRHHSVFFATEKKQV